MAVITISREPGAFGEEVAARVAGALGYLLVDKTFLAQLWHEADLDEAHLAQADEAGMDAATAQLDQETEACVRLLPDLITQLAEEHDMVLIGRGGQGLFRGCAGTLHVRLVASRSVRIRQVRAHGTVSDQEARRRIREQEKERTRYVRFLYGLNSADPALYDLVLGMDRVTIEQAVHLIAAAVDEMRLAQVPKSVIVASFHAGSEEPLADDRFVNEAEKEFARFLEFYRIPYQYEPRTFPLEVDSRGKVLEAFTPDFYLPQQDLFIELTTMKQSLVTRKNRKVRKLRRLYPEVNIRIFYQRDFYTLMAKYGLLDETPVKGAEAPDSPRR